MVADILLDEVAQRSGATESKKIVANVATRAAGKAWRGIRPNKKNYEGNRTY